MWLDVDLKWRDLMFNFNKSYRSCSYSGFAKAWVEDGLKVEDGEIIVTIAQL